MAALTPSQSWNFCDGSTTILAAPAAGLAAFRGAANLARFLDRSPAVTVQNWFLKSLAYIKIPPFYPRYRKRLQLILLAGLV